MLPTINKKFLFRLVLATVLFAGTLFGVHAFQARRIPDALKAQAERMEEQAATDATALDKSIHYWRQYLEFRTDDLDGHERLAALLRKRAKPGSRPNELLGLYDKILRLDPTRHETRREALKASLRIARFTDAETHGQKLTEQFPQDREAWLDLAFAQRGLQKQAEARASYEAAIACDPQHRGSYQEYAEALASDGRADEAKKVLDRLVEAMPNAAEAYVSRARFSASQGNERDTIADARKALELEAGNADAMLMLGEQLQKTRDGVSAAADLFKAGMAKFPADIRFVRNRAWLEVNRGNTGLAVSILEDGMVHANERDRFDLLVPLADLLLTLRDRDKPKQLIQKLAIRQDREVDPAQQKTLSMQVLYLNARLAMSEQRWGDAAGDLKKLREQCGELVGLECQTNLLLSYCQQRRGEFDAEEQTLKLLLGRDPNHLAGRRALGDFHLNAGRFDEAIAEYELASKSRYATADCRAKLLKMKAAKLREVNAPGRSWAELDALLDSFKPSFGDGTEYAILRGELLSARGASDRALAVVRLEAMKRPSDARLWSYYAGLAADFAGTAPGFSILDEAQAACGDRVELRLARANLSARDPAKLRPLDPLAASIDLWPEGDQTRLLYGLVEAYDRLGDEAGVIRTYRRIAGRYPGEKPVWEGLFDRASRIGDGKTAGEARAMILKTESDPTRASKVLDAWEVAQRGSKDAAAGAIAALKDAFGERPERSDVCVALARLQRANGSEAEAGELLARAVRLDPTRFGPTQEYLQFLAVTGNDTALSFVVARLGADYRWHGEPLRRAIRQTCSRVPPIAAKRLLDLTKAKIEREPDGLGWLGEAYAAAGFAEDATDCFAAAATKPGATADDWLRLALRRAEAKNEKGALEAMAAAKAKLGTLQLYLMTAALFAESPSAPKDWTPELPDAAAKKLYAQARLAVKLSRFKKDEAIDVLERYTRSTADAPAEQTWARRNLAMMLASRGTTTDRARAKELLTGDDTTAGESPDDRRATAAVLAGLSKQLEGDDRDAVLNRAIAVLTDVVRTTKSPRDKFLLSTLYRTSASWTPTETAKQHRILGRTMLQELLREDDKNLDYYIAALDEATEPTDRAFAEKCAAYLIQTAPTDFRVVQAVARFEVRCARPEKALAAISTYAKSADSMPGDHQTRSLKSAELLDELARKPDVRGTVTGKAMIELAVERYESLFEFRPDAIVAVAGLLALDGRADAAFANIEKHAKVLPARVKALAGLAVMRCGNSKPEHAERTKAWLDASKVEEPGSIAVSLNEAEYYSLARDYAAAEKCYRRVIDADDQNVIALNNLAWLLSANPDAADRALDLVDRAARSFGYTGELLDTRARIRIAQKNDDAAMQDLRAALKQEATALRLFHMALVHRSKSPKEPELAKAEFAKAIARGLTEASVHPADAEAYRELAAMK